MKQLQGLKWNVTWNSQLGAIKGCADYLGIEMSNGWLFGGSGAAFMLTMNDDTCGPAGNLQQLPMMRLCGNLGLAVHGVAAWKNQDDFQLQKRLAWENTKDAINRELPCYGYCLGIPEYYVVHGYANDGYLFNGIGTEELTDDAIILPPDVQKRLNEYGEHYVEIEDSKLTEELKRLAKERNIPLQGKLRLVNGGVKEIIDEVGFSMKVLGPGFFEWAKLGEKHNGLLEMYWVEPMRISDDNSVVKEALIFALEYAKAPKKWIDEGWSAGPAAYDQWIENLLVPQPNGFGLSYSGQCWAECRYFAVQFLEEAAERLGGTSSYKLKEAALVYREVANGLSMVAELLPFHERKQEHMVDTERIQEVVQHLRTAKAAELKGLLLLGDIVKTL
jgi:hypothetical protein